MAIARGLNIKRVFPKEKPGLHPRNRHRERYDFEKLIESCPGLGPFVKVNVYDNESIDFFNPEAVKMLNKALLAHFYGIEHWDIPSGFLCPPIPGRADYIHYLADLLGSSNHGKIPTGDRVRCLDIGVGASCIYPVIGNREYGWSFIGADIDPVSIESAGRIIEMNPILNGEISLRLQPNPKDIFKSIIKQDEHFDLTICNPPFHVSLEAARTGTVRKLNHLNHKKSTKPVLNFGGQNNELWCDGGEERFVAEMILQSKLFATSCLWFSTLVSKESSLRGIYEALKRTGAVEIKTIPMVQGNKISRIIAWTFLPPEQQKVWINGKIQA